MTRFNAELWELTEQLLGSEELRQIHLVVESRPLDFEHFLKFDVSVGGAYLSSMIQEDGKGQYAIEDRDVFRPLQYCSMYFNRKHDMTEVECFTRDIVQMSGLHIESLLNRIGEFLGFTLGRALNDKRVRKRICPAAWAQTDKFRKIYNAAKHDVTHDKDTHLFSVEDAVLAYFISRKLGRALYPLAKLRTSFTA